MLAAWLTLHAPGQSPWYYASGHPSPNNWDLFTDRDGKRHAANRRKVASLYSMTNLVQMEPYVATCTDLLERKLKEFAMSGVAFNLQHWLQCYAFDVIALITVSLSCSCCSAMKAKGRRRSEWLEVCEFGADAS